MSFSADWLAARRDADLRARNAELAQKLAGHFNDRDGIQVLDLGCGTGANLAATSAILGPNQHWTLADNDPDLLGRVNGTDRATFETFEADLATSLADLFRRRYDLVTASALFDLAGAAWIDGLVECVAAANSAFYTVLTYDGEERWLPPHAGDAAVLAAFHADQHSDKGLGPALGPKATDYLAQRFEAAGYSVRVGDSAWKLESPRDEELIGLLASGIRDAVKPSLGETADHWFDARKSAASVTIGHKDLLAIPAA